MKWWRGVVPGAKLCALTSKAGMSFSFMGIVLATPLSIQDSPPVAGGLAAQITRRRRGRTGFEIKDRDSRSEHPAHIFIAKQSQQVIENTGRRPKIGQNKANLGHFSTVVGPTLGSALAWASPGPTAGIPRAESLAT